MSNFMDIVPYSTHEWLILAISAVVVGLSKTSIHGLLTPIIVIFAIVFGGRESTSIILFFLIAGDIFAVFFYKRNVIWADIVSLMPPTFIGLAIGVAVGGIINDRVFKTLLAIIAISSLLLLVYSEKKGENFVVPQNRKTTWISGVLSGVASMIGNSAGPIFAVYLLSLGLKKGRYMGTAAWFFLIVNLSKVPLQYFFWDNVSLKNFILIGMLFPLVMAGAFVGRWLIQRIDEKLFRKIIVAMTAITAVRLLF